jgi:hypothetical protein
MKKRPDEVTRREAAERFRARRAELTEALTALLGRREAVAPVDDLAAAAAVEREFMASCRDAEPHEWAMVRHGWPEDDPTACAETLHALARNLGARPAWLVVPGHPAQAVALPSDAVLDNPFGFAALTERYAPELRLLDREVAAGLSLARRAHHMGTIAVYGWALEVWGEPWLSAATRALRGEG